jgi:hypothetical protein
MLTKLHIHLWLILHKIKRQSTSVVLLYQIVQSMTQQLWFVQSKLCSFHSDKLNDLTKIYNFSDSDASQYKNKKNSSTYAIIKIILVRAPSGTSLQCHMVNIYAIWLGNN